MNIPLPTNGANDDEGFRLYANADLPGIDLVPFVTDPVRLWENDGSGVFTDVAPASGLVDVGMGQGALTVDHIAGLDDPSEVRATDDVVTLVARDSAELSRLVQVVRDNGLALIGVEKRDATRDG